MKAEPLQYALSRAAVTRVVDIDTDAIARLPSTIAPIAQGRRPIVVADSHTMTAAGERTLAALAAAGIEAEAPVVLDEAPRLKPRADLAAALAERLKEKSYLPLAVGSGVISDLTKFASHVAGIPYVSVATAASMDGYAASGAALLDNGFKRTLDCAPPLAVVADLDVLARAPSRMAGWGYGDLSGKLVAGLDWVLADFVGEDAIAHEPFALVQDHLASWLAGFDRIARHDREALRELVVGLLVSGFAMQAHGNSRPASGSDHQFAHVWEMEGLAIDGEPVAHGACVGLGAVAMLAMYEWFLRQDVAARASERRQAAVADDSTIDAEVTTAFADADVRQNARREMAAKRAVLSRRRLRLERLRERWPSLRERLSAAVMPAAELQRRLAACGAASRPEDLGMTSRQLSRDYRRARLIRRRYTLLDCLDDLGWLDCAIDALFAPDGFWSRDARRSASADARIASAS